jgi:hypothetical protein
MEVDIIFLFGRHDFTADFHKKLTNCFTSYFRIKQKHRAPSESVNNFTAVSSILHSEGSHDHVTMAVQSLRYSAVDADTTRNEGSNTLKRTFL